MKAQPKAKTAAEKSFDAAAKRQTKLNVKRSNARDKKEGINGY